MDRAVGLVSWLNNDSDNQMWSGALRIHLCMYKHNTLLVAYTKQFLNGGSSFLNRKK